MRFPSLGGPPAGLKMKTGVCPALIKHREVELKHLLWPKYEVIQEGMDPGVVNTEL